MLIRLLKLLNFLFKLVHSRRSLGLKLLSLEFKFFLGLIELDVSALVVCIRLVQLNKLGLERLNGKIFLLILLFELIYLILKILGLLIQDKSLLAKLLTIFLKFFYFFVFFLYLLVPHLFFLFIIYSKLIILILYFFKFSLCAFILVSQLNKLFIFGLLLILKLLIIFKKVRILDLDFSDIAI